MRKPYINANITIVREIFLPCDAFANFLRVFYVFKRHKIPGGSNYRAINAVAGAVIITLE